MPKFKVLLDDSKMFWDGAHRHEVGTILNIEKVDYGRLLNASFEPMDAEAKADMAIFRAARAKALGKEAWAPTAAQYAGTLDPNKPGELKQITKGAEVVDPERAPNVVDMYKEIDRRVTEALARQAAGKK